MRGPNPMAEESKNLESQTGYTFIGFGLVAENKPLETKVVLYVPVEETPIINGDVVSQNQRLETKYKDQDGIEQTATLYTNIARPAIWLPDDTFRLTAPDVRRMEKIRLYRYGDSPNIYWKEMGDGKRKRRGETIVLGASARLNLGESGLTDDEDALINHYRVELSGHRKIINITTSDVNGEIAIYSLLLDGGGGRISLGDNQGNEFVLNTLAKQWALRNNEGTFIVLDKKNLLMGAEEGIYVQADESISMITKQLFMQSETMIVQAKQIQSSAEVWKHKGNFYVEGDYGFTGEGKATGGLHVTQKLQADQDVVSGEISLRAHKHRAQGSNSITSSSMA